MLSLPFAMSQSEPLLLPLLDVKLWLPSRRCGLVLGTGCLLLSAVGSVKDLAGLVV